MIKWTVDSQARAALLTGAERIVPGEELTNGHQFRLYVVEMVEGSALNALSAAKYSDHTQRHPMANPLNRLSSWLREICIVYPVSNMSLVWLETCMIICSVTSGRKYVGVFFLAKVDIYLFGVPGFFLFYTKEIEEIREEKRKGKNPLIS